MTQYPHKGARVLAFLAETLGQFEINRAAQVKSLTDDLIRLRLLVIDTDVKF